MKKFLISVVCCLSIFVCKAQQWKNYTCSRSVNCLKVVGDTIWVGSEGGAAKYLSDGTQLATYTRADGLASNFVNSIDVDLQGNVWFGTGSYGETSNGVTKFDGANFTTYNSYNSALADSVVSIFSVSPNGDKWFAVHTGYYKFDDVNWTFYSSADSALVHGMAQFIDSHGNHWVGLTKFDGTTLTKYTIPYGNLGGIGAIDMDSHDNLWVCAYVAWPGSQGGLFKFDGTSWVSYNGGGHCMKVDKLDNVWFAENGISKFDGVNFTSYSYNQMDSGSISCGSVTSIAFDSVNNLWVGTLNNVASEQGSGVSRFDGNSWQRINPSNSMLNDNFVTDINSDNCGNKWFATYSGEYGLSMFDETNWISYDLQTPNIDDVPVSTRTDHDNINWFGGTDAIYRFDGTNWSYFFLSPVLGYYSVDKMAVDGLNNLWCATYYGLYAFNQGNWSYYLPDQSVTGLAVEGNSVIWCTTYEGLYKYNGAIWTHFTPGNSGLIDSAVTAIAVDAQGNKWVGTDKGVQKYDGNTWVTYNTQNSGLPGNRISAIAIDKTDNKWFATYNDSYKPCGLTKFDGVNWTTYNIHNSKISANDVSVVSVDEQNNIWVGSVSGVSELLSSDSIYSVWVRFDKNICETGNITLSAIVNNGTPPYSYSWQSIGDTLSCNTCPNPTASITQNTIVTVVITDSENQVVSNSHHLYPCGYTTVANVGKETSIIVFPNPASEQLYIQTNGTPITEINVFNTSGCLLYQATEPLNTPIDISHWVAGVYIAEIKTKETSVRKKWIKM